MIGLEITLDGSKVLFLPLGLAALTNGGLIYLQEKETFGDFQPLTSVSHTLIGFGILAIIYAISLRFYVRNQKTDNTPDINQY